jgi:hypothetical protein
VLCGDSGEESVEALVGEAPVESAGGDIGTRFDAVSRLAKLCAQAIAEANPKCCKKQTRANPVESHPSVPTQVLGTEIRSSH